MLRESHLYAALLVGSIVILLALSTVAGTPDHELTWLVLE
jgi:hypothetical protein